MANVYFDTVAMCTPKILRNRFEEKLKSGIPNPPGKFHHLDLQRVKDDRYLMRIIAHAGNSTQQAVDLLWDILVWRATVGASDINETNIRMEYVKEGSIFPHGRDIDGCLLLVFRSKLFSKSKKNFEDMKRILIYWLDRIEREENGNKISLFCDMSDCGISDFDVQLSTYARLLFQKYYPFFFNHLIIFEMPWTLSTTFKMIKSVLPPRTASRMKFVTKSTISKIVQLDHALKSWGGRDSYEFEFVPENKSELMKPSIARVNSDIIFSTSGMITVKPTNTVIFRGDNSKLVLSILLTVANTHESSIFFEIRTTSEALCVNPVCGALDIGQSKSVVMVVQDFDTPTLNSLTMEKIMVIGLVTPNASVTRDEIYDIWQKSPKFKVHEYTFTSILSEVQDESAIIANSLNDIRTNNRELQNQLKSLRFYQLFTLIIVAVVAFGIWFEHIRY